MTATEPARDVRQLSDAQLRRLAADAAGDLLDDVRAEQLIRRSPTGIDRRRPAPARPWTDAEDQAIIQAWGRGHTSQQIAAQLRCTDRQVHDRIAALRAGGAELPRRRRSITESDRQHIARRRDQGATRQAVATELGVSLSTIRNHLRAR